MPIKLLMPALSPTMTEGTLGRWIKNEGDKIEPGDVIAEIETDKATMEFEAVDSGILAKILVPANSQGVKVNSVIGIIAEDGEDINVDYVTEEPQAEAVSEKAQEEKTHNLERNEEEKSQKESDRIFASPLAKNIATQNSIDLSMVKGTGPYGRIVKDDVMSAMSQKAPAAPIERSSVAPQDEIPVSTMRKVIAQRLLESKTTIPHFYLTVECNVSQLVQLREEINANYSKIDSAKKISVNDMIMRASSIALGEMPTVNRSWNNDKITQLPGVDISFAVALDDGLITPIVRAANYKSLVAISDEVKSLVKAAKEGKLRPDQFQGGSITISNLGMYNVESFLAIINPPQSSIISVGGIAKKPIVVQDEIKIASVMSISISCDHRVIDGALAAQFINRIKLYLENPLALI
jgi:pyruvate dehydrogenase E2 component (dihydrolipoamide acetyltransferase)